MPTLLADLAKPPIDTIGAMSVDAFFPKQEGTTLFDDIVTILRDHGEGGDESEDGVELRLVD